MFIQREKVQKDKKSFELKENLRNSANSASENQEQKFHKKRSRIIEVPRKESLPVFRNT